MRRERLGVTAGAKGESVDSLIAKAKELNHERVVLVAPGGVNSGGGALSGLFSAPDGSAPPYPPRRRFQKSPQLCHSW